MTCRKTDYKIKDKYRYFFPIALRSNRRHCLLILEVSRSHTTTHHSRYDCSGRIISCLQRPLLDNTRLSQETDIHAPRWDSNLQSQQMSGRRPTPSTDRPLGSANTGITYLLTPWSRVLLEKLTSKLCS